MGFLGKIFGEENKAPDAPPAPILDPRAQEFQDITFPQIGRGLQGGGLFSELRGKSIRDMLAATTEEFHETQRALPGMLARTIPKADFAVRDFISKSIGAQFARTKQGIREEDVGADFEEKNVAQNLAFGALGTEKRTAGQIATMFNQTMLARSFSPTFESALFGGLGGAAGTLAGSRPQSTPTPGASAPQFGVASVFSPAGGSYLSSQWLNPNDPAISYSRGFSSIP